MNPASKKPDNSVVSDAFLAKVRGMPQQNLAVELSPKLLRVTIATERRNAFDLG
jgi:type I restriction enzyme R subunit